MNMTSALTQLAVKRMIRRGASRRRRGGALLELAICGLLLAVILLGAIEGGQYFWVKSVMTEAARDGCRNGVLAYQAGVAGGGTAGPEGSISSVMGVIGDQLIAANLVPVGTTYSGSGPYTLGNFSVTFSDCNLTSGTSTTITNLSTMSVGDGLMVTITANWSVVGAPFHDAAFHLLSGSLSGNGHQMTTSCLMRKEAL
jgi:hypothetical protein